MERLLDAVEAVVRLVSPEKVQAIASRIRRTDANKNVGSLSGVVGTPTAAGVVERLVEAWNGTTVGAEELASMLLAASHVFTRVASQQSMELVWTGPTTPFVSARRTEQALLQVINSAEKSLFITSFVAYDVSTIVKALNASSARGVAIYMLLELSKDEGGRVNFDVLAKMGELVPTARLYAWDKKTEDFSGGSVHAKVAVADAKICFITSANLTGYAMEKNMEAGVILVGGAIAASLSEHLFALISTGTVQPVK